MTGGEPQQSERVPALVEQFKGGLAAPICLTWEWTYACNLACAHCLSSSGRRDPDELTTGEMMSVIDELPGMQGLYVHVGGGRPQGRPECPAPGRHGLRGRADLAGRREQAGQ